MTPASDLHPAELAALLHFYADAGVDYLLDDEPVDRFAEFASSKQARQRPAQDAQSQGSGQQSGAQSGQPGQLSARERLAAAAAKASPPPSAKPAFIPDAQAVAAARFAAESARSLAELKSAIESFQLCNLKNSARNTIFAEGDPASGIMIIGSMPDADDDREGIPFAGKPGQLLDKMLAAIGLSRQGVLLSQVSPWRPPGNRAPSAAEIDILRPFIERQIALAEPKQILLLGNVAARFFFGQTGTIHTLRGQWRDIGVDGVTYPAIASMHPQELLNAPASKALAWLDLQAFRDRILSNQSKT
jgi:uracil-DNA glycosylase family 4